MIHRAPTAPLGRRTQDQDPLGGLLATTYDPQDQPLSITDPRGLSTTYDPNAWGEVQRLDSPDTRSTVTTYDPAGNPLQQIDARGVSVTQSYDALNRNTSRLYPDSQQQFRYDRSTNGRGLLTDLQDSSGSQNYTYSKRRQVTRQSITLNGLAPLTLSYGYGKGGRLSRISYPSGRTATYSYRADGTLSQLRTSYAGTTQTVLKTTWNPTGQPTRLTYGNGLVEQRSYDLAGQLTQLNRNALGKLNYRYDLAGNITQIGTQNYTYDTLDRLISAPSRSYSYDANGNRLQDSGQSYVLAPDSNRLLQAANRVYDYDSAGNPLSDGRYQYQYDGQNRLTEIKQSTTSLVRSTYNALGQRVRKETAAGTTHYLYSSEGQLLAELDAVGNTQREYLYLQSWPVAVVSYSPAVAPLAADELPEAALDTLEEYPETAESAPVDATPAPVTSTPSTGSTDRASDATAPASVVAATPSVQLHYLHPDHLGTPRLATDSTQKVVWRWDSAPFGDTPALEDPDGDGTRVTLNLRFPGQYFDAETGLHYNYYRDYDPVTGRYIESDPIGLRGGVGTYGYVSQNPMRFIDPTGEVVPAVPAIPTIAGGCSALGGFLGQRLAQLLIVGAIANATDCSGGGGASGAGGACPEECPPCDPPEGTLCYVGPHFHPSRHFGQPVKEYATHFHIWRRYQRRSDCHCGWEHHNKYGKFHDTAMFPMPPMQHCPPGVGDHGR